MVLVFNVVCVYLCEFNCLFGVFLWLVLLYLVVACGSLMYRSVAIWIVVLFDLL